MSLEWHVRECKRTDLSISTILLITTNRIAHVDVINSNCIVLRHLMNWSIAWIQRFDHRAASWYSSWTSVKLFAQSSCDVRVCAKLSIAQMPYTICYPQVYKLIKRFLSISYWWVFLLTQRERFLKWLLLIVEQRY